MSAEGNKQRLTGKGLAWLIAGGLLLLVVLYVVVNWDDQPTAPSTTTNPAEHTWCFATPNLNSEVTRLTSPDGEVLFDNYWTAGDTCLSERGVYKEGRITAYVAGFAASLETPDGEFLERETSLKATITVDQLPQLAKAYNAIDRPQNAPQVRWEMVDGAYSPAEILLGKVLRSSDARDVVIPFTTNRSEAWTDAKIAAAYQQGTDPKDVARTIPGPFDEEATYSWVTLCEQYETVPAQPSENRALGDIAGSVAPLDLDIVIPAQNLGVYFAETELPCGVHAGPDILAR